MMLLDIDDNINSKRRGVSMNYDKWDLSRGRVLIVEDDAMVRRFLEVALQEVGLDVWSAKDGADALSILQKTSFDVLLLDFLMPGMTGLELSAQVRRSEPNLSIALISGSTALITDDEIAAAGITRTFAKPFDLNDLLTWINSVLP